MLASPTVSRVMVGTTFVFTITTAIIIIINNIIIILSLSLSVLVTAKRPL